MEQKLQDIYYDAETGLGSVDKLYRAAKNYGFTRKQVQKFVKKQSLNQIFKPVGKRNYFPIWSIVSMGLVLWGLDILSEGAED